MFSPNAPQAPAGPAPEAGPMAALPETTPMDGQDKPSLTDPSLQGGTGPSEEEIKAHLDSLDDQDKALLAEHLTPEFVKVIGLISGPEVANYLNQFADPAKLLVPVPREMAEEYLRGQGQQGQPQGAPAQPTQGSLPPQAPAQAAPMQPPAPPQGMMSPAV